MVPSVAVRLKEATVVLLATTLKTAPGLVVPMPTPPEARIRNWSTAVEAKSAAV